MKRWITILMPSFSFSVLLCIHVLFSYTCATQVTCETDFVQRNDKFVDLVHNLTQAFHQNSQSLLPVGSSMAVGKYGFDTLRDMKLVNGTSNVGDYLASCVGILGENVVLRRGIVITSPLLASYVHAIFAPARGTCQVWRKRS